MAAGRERCLSEHHSLAWLLVLIQSNDVYLQGCTSRPWVRSEKPCTPTMAWGSSSCGRHPRVSGDPEP